MAILASLTWYGLLAPSLLQSWLPTLLGSFLLPLPIENSRQQAVLPLDFVCDKAPGASAVPWGTFQNAGEVSHVHPPSLRPGFGVDLWVCERQKTFIIQPWSLDELGRDVSHGYVFFNQLNILQAFFSFFPFGKQWKKLTVWNAEKPRTQDLFEKLITHSGPLCQNLLCLDKQEILGHETFIFQLKFICTLENCPGILWCHHIFSSHS